MAVGSVEWFPRPVINGSAKRSIQLPKNLTLMTRRSRKPTTGVEPVTYHLQSGCSAIELRRRNYTNAPHMHGAI